MAPACRPAPYVAEAGHGFANEETREATSMHETYYPAVGVATRRSGPSVDAAVLQATKDGLADAEAGDQWRIKHARFGGVEGGLAAEYWKDREKAGIILSYPYARAHLIVPAVKTILLALEVRPTYSLANYTMT
jgi:hypothetical protein